MILVNQLIIAIHVTEYFSVRPISVCICLSMYLYDL